MRDINDAIDALIEYGRVCRHRGETSEDAQRRSLLLVYAMGKFGKNADAEPPRSEKWVLESLQRSAKKLHSLQWINKDWQPCVDLAGVATQIDNMCSGMERVDKSKIRATESWVMVKEALDQEFALWNRSGPNDGAQAARFIRALSDSVHRGIDDGLRDFHK